LTNLRFKGRHKLRNIFILIGITAMLILCGCSPAATTPIKTLPPTSSSTSAVSGTPVAAVNVSNFAFDPNVLKVAKGTTVSWTNKDSAAHTVTSDTKVFDSGNMAQGATYSFTFNDIGDFSYHCTYHSGMTAKISVQ
jgi:plastocyanin